MAIPLLLSGPLKVIRDAARAVKRTAGLMIERVTAGALSTLLGLPGLVVTEDALESQGEREVLHLFGQHEVASCPRCGQVSTAVHESEERCIRHLDIWGKGFSSGVVEGLDNAIRGIIRRAYGYHVFENFRLHVMVEHGKLSAPFWWLTSG